jgi:hypothetical protein
MSAPELLPVTFLRESRGNYDQLLAQHGVKAKPHNGKVSLVYDQLAARDDDTLA